MQTFGFQAPAQQITQAPGLNPWAVQQPLGSAQAPESQFLANALQNMASQANNIRTPNALSTDLLAEALLQHSYSQQQKQAANAATFRATPPNLMTAGGPGPQMQSIDPSQLQGITPADPSQITQLFGGN